ncbi:hypothetical protein ACFYXD_23240 [Streptomyces platensis]|uniref:hypothetical protein n=1 Tax=Streptomyces platensis TaxID=58346 RepID=UPI0036CA0488
MQSELDLGAGLGVDQDGRCLAEYVRGPVHRDLVQAGVVGVVVDVLESSNFGAVCARVHQALTVMERWLAGPDSERSRVT